MTNAWLISNICRAAEANHQHAWALAGFLQQSALHRVAGIYRCPLYVL
jgi:hypothetical protein